MHALNAQVSDSTTKPPAKTLLQQQDKFEDFMYECNFEGPIKI